MKKSLIVVMAFVLLVLTCSAWAAGGTSPVDAERVARALLNYDVAYYAGGFGFTRVYQNGAKLYVGGEFEMQTDGYISYLAIDGEEIVSRSDEPIGGLPPNVEGLTTDFWLWLSGHTSGENSFVYGNFFTNLLQMGDPIVVTLRPDYVTIVIPYTAPEGADSDNLRLRIGKNEFTYDSFSRGFQIWFNPLQSNDYEILDITSGAIYERGNLDNLGQTTGENIISLDYLGGVVDLSLSDANPYRAINTSLDSLVERESALVPAEVFFVRTGGQGLYLDFNSLSGKRVEVREWRPFGEETPVIFETDLAFQLGIVYGKAIGGLYYADLQIPPGYGRLIVTVLGNEETVEGDTFNIYASLYGGRG